MSRNKNRRNRHSYEKEIFLSSLFLMISLFLVFSMLFLLKSIEIRNLKEEPISDRRISFSLNNRINQNIERCVKQLLRFNDNQRLTVHYEVTINENLKLVALNIRRSSGNFTFDNAVFNALKACQNYPVEIRSSKFSGYINHYGNINNKNLNYDINDKKRQQELGEKAAAKAQVGRNSQNQRGGGGGNSAVIQAIQRCVQPLLRFGGAQLLTAHYEVTIDANLRASNARITRRSGNAAFDNAVVNALKACQNYPATIRSSKFSGHFNYTR